MSCLRCVRFQLGPFSLISKFIKKAGAALVAPLPPLSIKNKSKSNHPAAFLRVLLGDVLVRVIEARRKALLKTEDGWDTGHWAYFGMLFHVFFKCEQEG